MQVDYKKIFIKQNCKTASLKMDKLGYNRITSYNVCYTKLLRQTFNLKGLLKHKYFENWHGRIEFYGPVKSRLAAWVNSKGWFPDRLRPRIPCTVITSYSIHYTKLYEGPVPYLYNPDILPDAPVHLLSPGSAYHPGQLCFPEPGGCRD